jgi:integrase
LFDISPDTEMTFNELSKWYLDQEPVKKLASFDIIKMKLKKFNAVYGDKIVADIKKVDLQNFLIKREKEGKKVSTIDQDIGKVKAMISMSFENDMVSGKTLKVFRLIKKQAKKSDGVRDRILSPAEFEALLKHSTAYLKNIIATGYYTGMRRGEILDLIWKKVDLNKRLIQLEPEDTKDREARDIPICDELYEFLKNIPNKIQKAGTDNHVFLYRGQPFKDIRRGLKDACTSAGIKYGRNVKGGFVFHDLRHTFNTNMRKAGVDETVIMAITGHSTREMFDRYNSIDRDDIKKASKQFSGFVSKSNDAHSDAHKENISKKLNSKSL